LRLQISLKIGVLYVSTLQTSLVRAPNNRSVFILGSSEKFFFAEQSVFEFFEISQEGAKNHFSAKWHQPRPFLNIFHQRRKYK
jgi:hypothetical protein